MANQAGNNFIVIITVHIEPALAFAQIDKPDICIQIRYAPFAGDFRHALPTEGFIAVPNPGNLHIIKAESEHFNGCADHSAQLQMGPARVALIRRQGEIPIRQDDCDNRNAKGHGIQVIAEIIAF